MKKILTVRSQFLLVNQTFYSYEIHIRFKNSSLVKTLQPGDKFPLPESYNKYKLQFRISPSSLYFTEDEGGSMLGYTAGKDMSSRLNESQSGHTIGTQSRIN